MKIGDWVISKTSRKGIIVGYGMQAGNQYVVKFDNPHRSKEVWGCGFDKELVSGDFISKNERK